MPKGYGGNRILVQEPIRNLSLGILKRNIEECGVVSMHTAHALLINRTGGAAH